jgi:hypothetical protein
VWLRRETRRVHVYTVTCRSSDDDGRRISIDFPEHTLLRSAKAALEYEACGRNLRRYVARYPRDAEMGYALLGYVRSESRILQRLLGRTRDLELLRIVRPDRRASRARPAANARARRR